MAKMITLEDELRTRQNSGSTCKVDIPTAFIYL